MDPLFANSTDELQRLIHEAEGALARAGALRLDQILPGMRRVQCCGLDPMLRVRPQVISGREFNPVQFECRQCGRAGGASMSVETARNYWIQTMRLAHRTAGMLASAASPERVS